MKSSKHQKIPLIDLTESDYNLIPKLRHAFSTIGFVQVRGHGVNPSIISQLRRHLITYFNRPLKLKLQEAITPDNYRGYIPLGFFSPNVKGKTPDNYEGYKLHHEVASNDPIRELCDLYGPNKWPHQPVELQETALAYWAACDQVVCRLLNLLASIMGVDPAWFTSQFSHPLTNMTLMHYPSQKSNENKYGIHPHKDTDALTLLFPDKIGGLWLKPRGKKRWVEVSLPSDTMLVNIGDLLEVWSGGFFVSTPHKVVNKSEAARYAFPLFIVPRHDVVVAPLMSTQPSFFKRPNIPVGAVTREVWRTNWLGKESNPKNFDLGTLPD